MEKMSALDASFLDLEDAVSHMHIGSIGIFEGPPPAHEELRSMVLAKLPLVPRYRQVVRAVPLSIGRPHWVDDQHFNLDYHLRRTGLPAPGGESELRRLVGRVMSQQLDRSKPLWEMWAVEGLEQGVYHYDVLGRALERLYAGDLRLSLARAALDQRIAADAQAVFVWTAVLERSRWKYGERFLRYVLLDAGHIAENVALAATALGLGTCQIAAFYDEEAAAILGVDPELEPVIYLSAAGRPGDTRSTQPPLALR